MKNSLYTIAIMFLALSSTAKNEVTAFHPFLFVENVGQLNDQFGRPRNDIDLKVSDGKVNVFIGSGRLHYQWSRTSGRKMETYRLDVELEGANIISQVQTELPSVYYEQYYVPGCEGKTANSYGKVIYKDIYPGIDWVLFIKDKKLKHEFIVHEGADSKLIRLRYSGATDLRILSDGSLLASSPMGEVIEKSPVCYQENGSVVPSSYKLEEKILSYDIGNYAGVLTIDPTIVWGTYFGGDGVGSGDRINAIDQFGSSVVYIGGFTTSSSNIATVGSHQVNFVGIGQDAFIAKFDSAGSCIWSTYYGGFGPDNVSSVSCDAAGNVYAAGTTQSNTNIATPGSHMPSSMQGGIFLVKFNSAGVRQWGTYYGDSTIVNTGNHYVACEGSGFVYLGGPTTDTAGIATTGSYQPLYPGQISAYLAKFSSSGVRQWGTYYGGNNNVITEAVDVDPYGGVYIAGRTLSNTGISTVGSHQPLKGLTWDGFLVKFNDQGQPLWGTYYGSDSLDYIEGIACSDSGIYIGGHTNSISGIASTGSYQPTLNGQYDAFVARFDTAGQRIWSTYYGGTSTENLPHGRPISATSNGQVYISGQTLGADGISLPGAYQKNFGGGALDGFLIKFNAQGVAEWGTYYGGCNSDAANLCVPDGIGNVYVAGLTFSANAIATTGAHQDSLWGASDGFLARFNDSIYPYTVIGDTSVCEGGVESYSVPNVPDAISYTWVLPNGWQGTSTSNSIAATVTQPGGNIMVIVQKTCTSDTFQLSNVVVHPLPQPTVTQNQFVLSTSGYVSYQWYLNGSSINWATLQSHTAVLDGDYHVVVTDSNGCSNVSDTVTITGVSVPYLSRAENAIVVYPNPATNALNVSALETINDVSLSDVTGRKVYSATPLTSSYRIEIAVAPGIYYLTVTTDKARVTIKILISK